MRRWLAAPAILFAAAVLVWQDAPPVAAQPPAPEEESILTADGVQLKGVFHATEKNPASAPVVILMYPPGPDRDMTKGDWAGLAKALTEKGYHVFRFDWRGHGKSNNIKDVNRFWENPYLNGGQNAFNLQIRGGPPRRPLKDTLYYKDLARPDRYTGAYLNDLAAVRMHLDAKNDNKSVNTSSIYLVGAGDAATIGLAWLTAEWQRPAVFPNPGLLGLNVPTYEFVPQRLNIGGGAFPPEGGQDVSGCVWISPSRPATVSAVLTQKWVSQFSPKIRENNPMLFLYADKDAIGKRNSEFFYNDVLVAEPRRGSPLSPLKQTFIKDVKGGDKLSGVQLLGKGDPKVEETIITFLDAIQKERAKVPSKTRGYSNPYYVNATFYGFTP